MAKTKTKTEVATSAQSTAVAALKNSLAQARQRVADIAPPAAGGERNLRLQQNPAGWLLGFGDDAITVPEGALFAVDPRRTELGFIAFGGPGKAPARMVEPVVSGEFLTPNDLPPAPKGYDDWSPVIVFRGTLLGPDREPLEDDAGRRIGEMTVFEATTHGGRAAAGAVFDAIAERVEAGATDIVPLLRLEYDTYRHKKHGTTIATPVLEIVDWAPLGD